MNDASWWTSPDGTAHEKCQMVFICDWQGQLVVQIDYDPGDHPELRWMREGRAFFCPHCGDVWGRIAVLDSAGRQMPLYPITVACSQHPDSWNVPGSMLAGDLGELLPLLPEPILRREFEIHLQKAEREYLGQQAGAATGTHGS